MASGTQKRTRSERVAALELPPGAFERALMYCRRGEVLLRLGLCALTILALWCVTLSWSVPLEYQRDYTPSRNIVAKTEFQKIDLDKTREAKTLAANKVSFVYDHDLDELVQLRAALQNRALLLAGAKSLADLDKKVWDEFFPAPDSGAPVLTPEEQEQRFQLLHGALSTPEALAKLERSVAEVLAPYEQRGMMDKLPQDPTEGNQQEIVVIPKGRPDQRQVVKVSDVLIGDADWLKKGLAERLDSPEIATRMFTWLRGKLPTTLKRNEAEIRLAQERAADAVPPEYRKIQVGDLLAPKGKPLDDMSLLELEHQAYLNNRSVSERIAHSLASLGMFVALSVLCGVYVLHYEPKLVDNLRQFSTTLAMIVVTVGLSVVAARDNIRAELVPLVVFGMTLSIAFHREFALLFSAVVTVIVVVATGQGLGQFMILYSAVASSILLVGSIRNRRKLIYVGLAVGVVATLTTVGVETLDAQPFASIWPEALRYGLLSVFAGLLMLGLLPFIESLFGVQTELSLLELGDVAHPLLQELVRRAPGTYNHSINVASIAEAAAESIGAKGLLVRVGAYFHDIGKMLKPGYFVENQGHDANRHESLVPAMSTLIIIAHIKDGADLARQHRLPKPIIDFIEQHHGTTLVEYFFRRASEANPDGGEVDESNFRYPGPKPQTKEAAVLMLADAVEGASRALVEPTPSRIENLVHDIAMKRLLDGQFDACGLTLQELATIEDSLVKSLTAVYHGRVKYPDQRTA
jgi:putative nucleotidyltransferase with HDIG domain